MKKLLAVILAVLMLLSFASLAACGEKQEEVKENEETVNAETENNEEQQEEQEEVVEEIDWTTHMGNGELVATIFPTMAPEALQQISAQWAGVLEEHGYSPDHASAELDPTQFVPLIENYVTMGAVLLCISPMDPTGIEDVVTTARENGVYITMLSAQPQYEIDGGLTTDNYMTGVATAKMMLDFIDKKWPDAEAKSIPVAVCQNTNLQEYKARTQGIMETLEASEKAFVTYTQEGTQNTADAGFNFAEAALTSDNTCKCFIMFDADQLVGINNYIVAMDGVDLSEYCVVATGNLQPEVEELINISANNESAVRGLTSYGGATPGLTLAEIAMKLLSGAEEGPVWSYDEIFCINSFDYEFVAE